MARYVSFCHLLQSSSTSLQNHYRYGAGVTLRSCILALVLCVVVSSVYSTLVQNSNMSFPLLVQYLVFYWLQSHSSVERASLIGHVKMRLLPTDDKFSLRGDTLQKAIEEDRAKGLIPFYVSCKMCGIHPVLGYATGGLAALAF